MNISEINCNPTVIYNNGCITAEEFHTPDSHACLLKMLTFLNSDVNILFSGFLFSLSHLSYFVCVLSSKQIIESIMTDIYKQIATDAMATMFNRKPRGFQEEVIPHLIKMLSGAVAKQAILMIQPTGSGKSTVPLTASVVDGGVTFIIENTLALGTDQCSKVNIISSPVSTGHIAGILICSPFDCCRYSKQLYFHSPSMKQCLTQKYRGSVLFFSS